MMSHWGDISNKYCGGEIEGNQQNVYFLIKRTYISDFKVSYGEDSIVGKDTTCCRSGINFFNVKSYLHNPVLCYQA